MSIEAPVPAARATALRLAFAAAIALVWGAATEEMIPGYAATFAMQMLAGGAGPPTLRQATAQVAAVTVSAVLVLILCVGFLDHFEVAMPILAFLLLLGFLAQERGGGIGQLAGLGLLVACVLPPYALTSSATTDDVAWQLVIAITRAVLIVWLVHLLFPAPPPQAAPESRMRAPAWDSLSFATALAKVGILLPVLLFYMIVPERPALTALLGLSTFLSVGGGEAGRAHFGVRVAGNALGGTLAAVAGQVVAWYPSVATLFLATLLGSLAFARRFLSAAPADAAWIMMAFVTFVSLLGLTVSPEGYQSQVLWRIFDITAVGLYAVGAGALLLPSPSPHRLLSR